jgi:pyrroline-5-carboxylate reductase
MNKKITIIGAGHMGMALYKGFIHGGKIKADQLTLSSPHIEPHSNVQAVQQADIVIIAVKPRLVKQVVEEIRESVQSGTLIISVAACVTTGLLEKYFQREDITISRILPNIPVAYGKGVIGVYAQDTTIVNELLQPLGMLIPCTSDEQLEKVSMICGCGPGYVGYFMTSLAIAAQAFGFSEQQSQQMIKQMFYGTALHVEAAGITGADLLTSVATKGGITEEVVKSMSDGAFLKLFVESIENGFTKVKDITKELEA